MTGKRILRQPANNRIQKQRKRGVIPSIRGFFNSKTKEGNSRRKILEESIRMARKQRFNYLEKNKLNWKELEIGRGWVEINITHSKNGDSYLKSGKTN